MSSLWVEALLRSMFFLPWQTFIRHLFWFLSGSCAYWHHLWVCASVLLCLEDAVSLVIHHLCLRVYQVLFRAVSSQVSHFLHTVQVWFSAHDHWLQKEAASPISVECVCRLTSLLDPRNSRPRGRHGDMSYSIFFRFLTFILHFWWLRRKPSWRFL